LDEHLEIFLTEKNFDTKKIIEDVHKGKKIVEQLSVKLPVGSTVAEIKK
jgi:hypothetical protein